MSPTEHIINLVSSYYGIPAKKMYSKSRVDSVVHARWMTFWLLRQSLQSTTRGIQRRFDFDETTIRDGIRYIERMIKWDDSVKRDTEYLAKRCKPYGPDQRLRVLAEQNALNEYAKYAQYYSKPPYAYRSPEDRRYAKEIAPKAVDQGGD